MQTTRIMIVEDDYVTAMLLTDVLENANYTVTTAPNGEAAQQSLIDARTNGAPYTVVITDLLMEGVDGIGVLRTARQQEPPAEVIVLTGFGSCTSAIDALRAGAYDYLLKPCKVTQLLACVASAAEEVRTYQWQVEAIQYLNETAEESSGLAQAVSASPIHASQPALAPLNDGQAHDTLPYAGPLHLDRFRDVAFFNDAEIALTPTEYLLLYCLLEGGGRVLSYQELARNTYGYEISNAQAQTLLKAHIYHLRRKIEPSYLLNVRGVGYRLATGQTHAIVDENPRHVPLKNTLSEG